jgi:hypothetical protein
MNPSDKKIDTYKDQHDIKDIIKGHEKPDFTPDKDKIKGPSHVKSVNDKVTMGDNLSDNFIPFGNREGN